MDKDSTLEHAMSTGGIENGMHEAETALKAQLVQVSGKKKRNHRAGKKVQAELAKRRNAQQAPTGTGKLSDMTICVQAGLTHVSKPQESSGAGSTSSELYEIRPAPGKGMGLFAKQDITRGTRILAEPALMSIDDPECSSRKAVDTFKLLSPDKQAKFMALHEYTSKDVKSKHEEDRDTYSSSEDDMELPAEVQQTLSVMSIFSINAFTIANEHGQTTGWAIFPIASRINHSCVPNVHNSYNSTINLRMIHAIRLITAEEEITTTYIGSSNPAYKRQQELEPYGFRCSCSSCETSLEDTASDTRRERIVELNRDITWHELKSAVHCSRGLPDALKAAEELALMLEAEGIFHLDLATAYRKVAKYSEELKKWNNANQFAEKYRCVVLYCVGTDHPSYGAVLRYVERVKEKKMEAVVAMMKKLEGA